MIVALLVLIVLILLFGAAAVKGWLANIIVALVGFAAICAAMIWLGSFFGENGFGFVAGAIGGIMLLLCVIGMIADASTARRANEPGVRSHVFKPETAGRRRPPKPSQPREPRSIERVWGWFAQDIALRFTPEARATAHALYDSNNALALDRFCREEIARLK